MSQITDKIRASASEIYHGDEICRERSKNLLKEIGLPNGLLPLKDIVECGYVKETGFVWLIQKKPSEHKFEKIGGKLTKSAAEVTGYVEKNRVKKLTGFKAKELFMWISLSEVWVDDPPTGKITFKTPTGLFRSYPTSAFEVEEEEAKEEENDDHVQAKEKEENEVKVNAAAADVAPVEVNEVM